MANKKASGGASIHVRRAVSYIVLILLSFLCLFWFYVLFINATRSNGELGRGFTAIPSTHLIENLNNMLHSSQPMLSGLRNSVIISACTAALCTYFSVMTAYAIHSYDFKGKKAIFTFILAIMMIPTQVSALGFIRLITKMHLMDNFIPLIIPAIASPVTFFYMKQYMESNLPSSLIEAARIDGAGEFYTFNTPALVLHDDKMKTLPILIAQLRAADWLKFDMGQVYAAIAFSIFPVIIVYLILSKYIVGGVAAGAVKG